MNTAKSATKKLFRLYANDSSIESATIFDLATGTKETKQTKSLAFVISQFPEVLLEIAKVCELQWLYIDLKREWSKISKIDVVAEYMLQSGRRCDIVVRIDVEKKLRFILVIEAKSAIVSSNLNMVKEQVIEYKNEIEQKIQNKGVSVFALILNKYKAFDSSIYCLTWFDIQKSILKIKDHSLIIDSFHTFLTEIDKTMHYYEHEVISIPAGITHTNVAKFFIYECPNTKVYNYKKTIYLAFRKSNGGEMDCLYKVNDILIFNPSVQSDIDNVIESLSDDDIKSRLIQFIKVHNYKDLDHEKRFYLLSKTETIPLKHRPHPKVNNSKFTYYRLSDILQKTELVPVSQINE